MLLPAPDGPTRAVMVPGEAHVLQGRDVGLFVAEADVLEHDAGVGGLPAGGWYFGQGGLGQDLLDALDADAGLLDQVMQAHHRQDGLGQAGADQQSGDPGAEILGAMGKPPAAHPQQDGERGQGGQDGEREARREAYAGVPVLEHFQVIEQGALVAAEAGAAGVEGAHDRHGLHEFDHGGRYLFTGAVVALAGFAAVAYDDTQDGKTRDRHGQGGECQRPVEPQQHEGGQQGRGVGPGDHGGGVGHEDVQGFHVVVNDLGDLPGAECLHPSQRQVGDVVGQPGTQDGFQPEGRVVRMPEGRLAQQEGAHGTGQQAGHQRPGPGVRGRQQGVQREGHQGQ